MIEKWTESSLLEIADLEKECFSNPWNLNMLKSAFETNTFQGFLIKDGEKIVSYIGVSYVLDSANIDLIATSKDYRRKGYAKRLIEHCIQFLKEKGVIMLFLEVRSKNEPAKLLYSSLGFEVVNKRINYYGDDDALIMVNCIGESNQT